MDAGRLDRRVTVKRRSAIAPRSGNERGAFAAVLTVWGSYRPLNLRRELEQAGVLVDGAEGIVMIRSSQETTLITSADRVVIAGQEFDIVSVDPPDRSGYLRLRVRRDLGNA